MASETTLTSHQRSYNDLKSLVESGHGIAVHEYRRDDGTLMRRYVVAYNADGDPVRRSDLKRALDSGDNGLHAPKIKQINNLAQTIIDSHRRANDSTPDQQRQAAFYTRGGIHYVKSDTVEREDTHEHKDQTLKTPERTTYEHAFGGVVGGITGEQKEVLDFGPTLVGKAPDADISAELNALKDKNFVQIFRSIRAKPENSGKSLTEIYTKALQKYTSDTIKAFQVSLNPTTDVTEVAKSLQKAAHKIAVPATAEDALSDTWLDDHAEDFGTRTTAEAVFQAIQEVGAKEVGADPIKDTQTTADHAYQALVSKVNQYWVETNRDTSIHDASFVDLPVGGSPLGGSPPPHGAPHSRVDEPHGFTLVNAKDVLPKTAATLQEELRRLEQELDELKEAKQTFNTNWDKFFDAKGLVWNDNTSVGEAVEAFVRLSEDPRWASEIVGFDRDEENIVHLTAPIRTYLLHKIPEVEQQIRETSSFYSDPVQFTEDLRALKAQRAVKAEELTHAWRGPLGSKSTIQQQIDALDTKIAAKEAVLKKWETTKERLELLTVYLHHGNGTAPKAEDYRSLYIKVTTNTYDAAMLTPGEIGALQTWKLPESVDPSVERSDGMIGLLLTHLTQSVMTIALEDMGRTIATFDTTSGEYQTWAANNQRVRDFHKRARLLRFEEDPAEFGNHENKDARFALRVAHDAVALADPSLTAGTEAWKTAMLESLKGEAFKAITPELEKRATSLGTDLPAIRGTNPALTATHYLHIHEYLKGEDRDLTSEEIHALDKLLSTANHLQDHEKLEFLADQARQHYTYLRMEAETLGQSLVGWSPTEDHLRGAIAWLSDPIQVTPNDDVKKALLLVKPDSASGIGQVEASLEQAFRIAKLEASAVDPTGYDYTTEDVLAVREHLRGSSTSLTEDQIKAFKKMQTGAPLAYKDKLAYYPSTADTLLETARNRDYRGSARNWGAIWLHVDGQLSGFVPPETDPRSITKAVYDEAIRKLTASPLEALDADEKHAVHFVREKLKDTFKASYDSEEAVLKGYCMMLFLEKYTPVA